VAVQCDEDDAGGGAEDPGFTDPRRSIYRQQVPAGCGCPGNVASFYCWYCGIAFDDDVLHAIHMGCHSVADKFVCNVCGLACGDRYGFNSHLVRGHVSDQSAPAAGVVSLQLPGNARLVPQTASLPLCATDVNNTAWPPQPRLHHVN